MKLPSLLHGGLLIISVAGAQTFPITGPQDGVNPNTGARPVRQDIKTFQKSGPAWDLYIQALQNFMQTDSTQLLSYFQVAGKKCSYPITQTGADMKLKVYMVILMPHGTAWMATAMASAIVLTTL
jgi:hypothetical protein